MTDKILMPKALTAENGAKYLMIGEFHEHRDFTCPCCHGEGRGLKDDGICCVCDGAGEITEEIPVSWTTIKAIYAMAVEKLGEETNQ